MVSKAQKSPTRYTRKRLTADQAIFVHQAWLHGSDIPSLVEKLGVKPTLIKYAIKRAEKKRLEPSAKKPPRRICARVQSLDRSIRTVLQHNPLLSSAEIAAKVQTGGGHPSPRNVLHRLAAMGARCLTVAKALPLTDAHKASRIAFCRSFSHDDLTKTVFSDEKLFQIKNWGAHHYVLPGKKRITTPVKKFCPRVMVWGGISLFGKTPLIVIKGTLDSKGYCDVLKEYKKWLKRVKADHSALLLQDKAPVHTSGETARFLQAQGLKTVPNWPPNSPDLNPIELVWGWMSNKVRSLQPTTQDDLVEMVQHVWSELDEEMIGNFIMGLPKRMEQVQRNEGAQYDKNEA
jgi:hypothetical protein